LESKLLSVSKLHDWWKYQFQSLSITKQQHHMVEDFVLITKDLQTVLGHMDIAAVSNPTDLSTYFIGTMVRRLYFSG
jgi:hypothetical protein